MNLDYPLAQNPFALSLSKGCPWFDAPKATGPWAQIPLEDKLTMNGFSPRFRQMDNLG
jgi:transposase